MTATSSVARALLVHPVGTVDATGGSFAHAVAFGVMATPTSSPTTAPARTPVEPETRPKPGSGDGDHDRFTHYVSKRELERSRRQGTAVTALCGKRWKPNGDPSRYPMCPTCSEIAAERLVRGLGG